jgi:hypothetical protein
MGDRRAAYNVLVGRSEGKKPLGRPRRRWEDHIKKCDGEAWIGFTWLWIGRVGGLL